MGIKSDYINRLADLGIEYVWQITKHSMPMDKVLLATKLYHEWKSGPQTIKVDDFFKLKAEEYGIKDNYRMLIIACFYGFVNNEGNTYSQKNVTPIFLKLKASPQHYDKIISQQLLKIKFSAITAKRTHLENDFNRHIFPVVFLYQVLKQLKNDGIDHLTQHDLYTYVMTSDFHEDISETVSLIKDNSSPLNPLLDNYKERSRFVTALKNIYLFEISSTGKISINPRFEMRMDQFLEENIDQFMNIHLSDERAYTEFLHNDQGWSIDLVNIDDALSTIDTQESDEDYVDEVMSDTEDITESDSFDNSKNEPSVVNGTSAQSVKRNPRIGAMVIKSSDFKCQYNPSHETFVSNKNTKPYMEAHHLIPVNKTMKYWKEQAINIDCEENVVSLCPNCHRAVHHGNLDTKMKILKKLYNDRETGYQSLGLTIDFAALLKEYI